MNRFLFPGALLALALVYPLLVQSLPVYERLGALVLLGAIGASAWNIVGGYAGQVSIGHAVFFGFGAYSSVVVYTHLGWPPIAGAPLGMALSVLLAAAIGVPTLRLSGHYFSMATIAVGELVRVLSST
ncbi:MAG TPA: branched-chain amino acid ABC transporter permease, partial [Reyranella sp.]|nr:branched-chain amino acid ABC transporter permease [Reyranella sp.]